VSEGGKTRLKRGKQVSSAVRLQLFDIRIHNQQAFGLDVCELVECLFPALTTLIP
jgi:hypothetical protein